MQVAILRQNDSQEVSSDRLRLKIRGGIVAAASPDELTALKSITYGGGGGNRTRVHNRYSTNVYMLSVLLFNPEQARSHTYLRASFTIISPLGQKPAARLDTENGAPWNQFGDPPIPGRAA